MRQHDPTFSARTVCASGRANDAQRSPWPTASIEQRERPHELCGASLPRARAARRCLPIALPTTTKETGQ